MHGLYDGEFIGFKVASSEQLNAALRDAVVAVDANVLLDLYRFRPQTSQDLIKTLKTLGDRLVVPHQALREFWRRRQRSQDSPRSATKTATDAVDKSQRSICGALATWARAVGVGDDELSGLTVQVNDFLEELSRELQNVLRETNAERDGDPILEQLDGLLAGRVTSPLDPEEWAECVAEAKRRIESEEPPGYLDADKEGGDLAEGGAGDYLLWYQATRYAKQQDRDLLIVTRDQKEDWWWRQQSDLIGPRPELTLEYYELTGRRLFLMSPGELLKRSSILDVNVDQASPADAERVANIEGYPYVENGTGRRYRLIDLTAHGSGFDNLSYEWHGAHLPEGRRWKYSRENMDKMYAEGRIEFRKNGFPVSKRYLDELAGPSIQNSEESDS
jgi:hypothetical protein